MKSLLFLLSLIFFSFSPNILANDRDDLEEAQEEEMEAEQEAKIEETKDLSQAKIKPHATIPQKIDTSRPPVVFKKDFLEKEYKVLFNILQTSYVPNVVLQNLAFDLEYTEGESIRFLDAISFLDRTYLEKLLSFYDERNQKDYKRLITRIKRKKASRKDIPHARIFREAIDYRYSRAKASKREQILIRLSKLNTNVQIKDLSTYSLDELIKEIEARNWNIKLERHPASLKDTKKPII